MAKQSDQRPIEAFNKEGVFASSISSMKTDMRQRAIATHVAAAKTPEELSQIIINALNSPNGDPQILLQIASTALFAINNSPEVSEWNTLKYISSEDDTTSLEGAVYHAIRNEKDEPELVAQSFQRIVNRLEHQVRKGGYKTVGKKMFLILIDLYTTSFHHPKPEEQFAIDDICEGKIENPGNAVLKNALQFAKSTKTGSFENDIEEWCFADVMSLFLVPFIRMRNFEDVQAIILKNGTSHEINLFNAIVSFQRLLEQNYLNNDYDSIIGIIPILWKRDIHALNMIVANADDGNYSSDHYAGFSKALKRTILKEKRPIVRQKFERIHHLWDETITTANFYFGDNLPDGSESNDTLDQKPVSEFDKHFDGYFTQLSRRDIAIHCQGVIADLCGIKDIQFKAHKGEHSIKLVATHKSGGEYTMTLKNPVDLPYLIAESKAAALVLYYGIEILKRYNFEKKELPSESFNTAGQIAEVPSIEQNIDKVDPETAEVHTVREVIPEIKTVDEKSQLVCEPLHVENRFLLLMEPVENTALHESIDNTVLRLLFHAPSVLKVTVADEKDEVQKAVKQQVPVVPPVARNDFKPPTTKTSRLLRLADEWEYDDQDGATAKRGKKSQWGDDD